MSTGTEALADRFAAFLSQLDGAESIDRSLSEDELAGGKRADYLLNHRQIVVELKSLKVDPEYKVEKHLKPYRKRPDFPLYMWESDLNEILPHLSDGEQIRHGIFHAVTRSVQGALENADDQIGATKNALGIPNACGVVVLLNEQVGILSPEVITAKASQILLKKKSGDLRYKHIAYAWIVCESHSLESADAFERLPLILLDGPTADEHVGLGKYLETLQQRWAAFENLPFHGFLETSDFDGLKFKKRNVERPAEDNQRRLVRHEVWRHQYRQNPYLRGLCESDFLDHAERVIVTMTPHFLKDGQKLPEDAVKALMVGWTHVLEEAEFRRLDMRKLQQRLPDFSKLTGRTE